MSKVFVLDSYYKPLDPVHPGWARLLLKQGKASVYRRFPFTIILKTVVDHAKGTQDIKEYLVRKPDLLKRVLAQAKSPLKDAAAVNITRWALYERLKATGIPVECGSGGLTKFNRTTRDLPKEHWIDASCVVAPLHAA